MMRSEEAKGAALKGMPGTADRLCFQDLFEKSPGLFLVLTPDLKIVAVSDAYLQATLTERGDILKRDLFEVFPDNPDDPAATGTSNLRASLDVVRRSRVADAMAVQKYDIRHPVTGHFEERYWSPMNSPIFGKDGSLTYIIHRVEDVTEFVKLKQQGQALNNELRERAERMESEIFLRSQELRAVNIQLRQANVERERDQAALQQIHNELERRVQDRTRELEGANETLRAEIAARQQMEQALRASEAQLRQAQKMEAVGQLAGGVAHDFNNLLTIILGYGDILLNRRDCDVPERDLILAMCEAGERAALLTRQLLAFSRKQVLEPKVLNLNTIVAEIEKMLRRIIGEDVTLATNLASDLRPVKVDAGQVEQVILNLAINARDAMLAGGSLTIETANVQLDESYSQSHPEVKPGPYAMLAVIDTGCGMDEAIKARMFEPFFTTKGQGKGTGLGLATVYGIVKQSGGSIGVYSEQGRGTAFKIYFPIIEGGPSLSPDGSGLKAAPHGNETILLVEDEHAVRSMTRLAFKRYGYTVLEASNGEEAIRVSQQHLEAIHLLVSDVVMPGMSGREIAESLRRDRPSMRLLFVSGYTDDAVVRHGILQAETAFLQKPFTLLALANKVREVLDGWRS